MTDKTYQPSPPTKPKKYGHTGFTGRPLPTHTKPAPSGKPKGK